MERNRSELITLVEQKHAESTNYHLQLQNMVGEKSNLQSALQNVNEKLVLTEEQLTK